ncbi:hypothetical protein T10_910 [Trichinella papuae]|uniref:Uncharacterized protein n=1 Tax=Trichinella papuae TaxID=268474 RepID=A0A0V1N568_9BILA|nr:hypothetical protein T10_910 [Trichinella papuae]
MLINLAQVMIIIYLSKAARNWTHVTGCLPMQLRHVREHLGAKFFPKLPTKTTAPQTLAAWRKYLFVIFLILILSCFTFYVNELLMLCFLFVILLFVFLFTLEIAEGMMFKVENENGFEIIDAYSSA